MLGPQPVFSAVEGTDAPRPLLLLGPAGRPFTQATAVELAGRIRRKDVSAREVMTAHLDRIGHVNPKVNAIVTLVAERALADAARADDAIARGQPLGPLHGLPVAHKDLVDTAGIRTTRGSPFYRDNVPTQDALIITRIRQAGAVTLGKTNTPEFGAGSQTFNTVFGATLHTADAGRALLAALTLASGTYNVCRNDERVSWVRPWSVSIAATCAASRAPKPSVSSRSSPTPA